MISLEMGVTNIDDLSLVLVVRDFSVDFTGGLARREVIVNYVAVWAAIHFYLIGLNNRLIAV
jgi:hypothetical protein